MTNRGRRRCINLEGRCATEGETRVGSPVACITNSWSVTNSEKLHGLHGSIPWIICLPSSRRREPQRGCANEFLVAPNEMSVRFSIQATEIVRTHLRTGKIRIRSNTKPGTLSFRFRESQARDVP